MSTSPKVTAAELKTFIDAVEFAADNENWVPSERQWKRIREMINNLETPVVMPAPFIPASQPTPNYSAMQQMPSIPMPSLPIAPPAPIPFSSPDPSIPIRAPAQPPGAQAGTYVSPFNG